MSGRYLTELAAWLAAAGLDVDEYPDWQIRARSSGGYADGRPWCVMWHHTASDGPLDDQAAYCATGSPDAPICNALIGADGRIVVIAAGATNTNGKGYPLAFSRGTVPADQMNTHAVGLELVNGGTGTTYPAVQIDAAMTASLTICARLGLEPTDAAQHHDYAPDRKIDPARAEAVAGAWHPHAVNTAGSWSLGDLRAELAARAGTITQEDEPTMIAANDETWTVWVGDGMTRRPFGTENEFNCLVMLAAQGAVKLVNVNGRPVRGFGDLGEPVPADVLTALGRPV